MWVVEAEGGEEWGSCMLTVEGRMKVTGVEMGWL